MHVPRAGNGTSVRGASAAGPRGQRPVVLWLAVVLGLVLGVLLAGPAGLTHPPRTSSPAQVERLREDLAAITRENAALARLLETRDLGDPAPAPSRVVRLVDATSEAVNGADVRGLERLFTSSAVLTDLGTERVLHGARAIALAYGQLDEPQLERTSQVFEVGGQVVWAYDTGVCVGEVTDGRFRELVLLSQITEWTPERPGARR